MTFLLRQFGLGDAVGWVGLALIVASLLYWRAYAERRDAERRIDRSPSSWDDGDDRRAL